MNAIFSFIVSLASFFASSPLFQGLFRFFFWSFNATLLLILFLGLLPFLGTALIADATRGEVPLNLLVTFVGLIGVPTATTIAALPKQRRSLSLFQLFYGVEAPLLTLCLVRFFWLRDLTPASALLLVTGTVCTVVFAHWLIVQQENPKAGNGWHLLAGCLLLAIALYLMTIALFFVPPFVAAVLMGAPVMLIYLTVLLPLTLVLGGLLSLPFGMAIVYAQSCSRLGTQLGTQYGLWQTRTIAMAGVGAWLTAVILLQQQPQLTAFRLLNGSATTDQERQVLLSQSEPIRQGLLNAYLSPYRYPRFRDDAGVQDLYYYSTGFPLPVAQRLQDAFNFVTAPFTYQGDRKDAANAAALYARFFDAPILRGEQAAVQKALQSTFNRGEAKAGLDDINQERVWLSEQRITVKPAGDWAEIELYEVYENQTLDLEEVLYLFSLPESAAITGVWLSDEANVPQKYPFVIASRGAAQQVYSQEVQRNVDPALLEQVGPRNYRLRAFPVPAMGNGKLYLWMRYKVPKQGADWAFPQLSERRNVFWTDSTPRSINGQRVKATKDWFPETISSDAAPRQTHQMSLPWGANLLATPLQSIDYQLPQNKRFAVIIDGSRSMEAHRQELAQTLDWLQKNVLTQNKAEVYWTATGASPKKIDSLSQFNPLDPQKAVFYGSLQPGEILQPFQQISRGADYDAVLLLTDSGSYELTEDHKTPLKFPAPLWLVHLGGMQAAYDDATLQAIQDSGGGVATQVQEVMQRIGTRPSRGEGTSLLNVVDGYAWYLVQPPAQSANATGFPEASTEASAKASTKASTKELADGFMPLAARQWVTHLSRYVKPDRLKELDTIHAITQEYGIVSPYSSMIVLVNDRQRENLKQAEQGDDRFQREVEDQQLPQPSSAGLVAVPEPAEWLLLAIGIILVVGYWHRHRVNFSANKTSL